MSRIVAEEMLRAVMDDADEPKPGNPIHSTDGAREYGFRAALIGGATVYGWAVRTIVGVLGERWLNDGWAHVRFRTPVYPDDTLHVRVYDGKEFGNGDGGSRESGSRESGSRESGSRESDSREALGNEFSIGTATEVAVAGEIGLGRAPWFDDIALPGALTPTQRPRACPRLTPDNVPVGRDLAARAVTLTAAEAIAFARGQERETLPQFFGDAPWVHPAWLASQPIHLLHHSFDYGPAIHVESHIQHMTIARADQTLLVAGRCVAAYARKGHQYVVNDCLIRDAQGSDVARIRHTVIYQVAKRA